MNLASAIEKASIMSSGQERDVVLLVNYNVCSVPVYIDVDGFMYTAGGEDFNPNADVIINDGWDVITHDEARDHMSYGKRKSEILNGSMHLLVISIALAMVSALVFLIGNHVALGTLLALSAIPSYAGHRIMSSNLKKLKRPGAAK